MMYGASSPSGQQNKLMRMIVSGVVLLVIAGYFIYVGGIDQMATNLWNRLFPKAPDYELARSHYKTAVDAINAGYVNVAISEFTSAIEADPSFADAWFQRGMAVQAFNAGKGIADLAKVVELKGDDPAYADAYFFRGALYEGQGMLEEAVADYTRYLNAPDAERIPNYMIDLAKRNGADASMLIFSDALVLYSRGQLYLRLDKLPEATDDFLQALSLDRNNTLLFIQQIYPELQRKVETLPEGQIKTKLKNLIEQAQSAPPLSGL